MIHEQNDVEARSEHPYTITENATVSQADKESQVSRNNIGAEQSSLEQDLIMISSAEKKSHEKKHSRTNSARSRTSAKNQAQS